MPTLLIKNIATLVTGNLQSPLRQADSIFIKDGAIAAIGKNLNEHADQTIDANGITAIPGLIDSHSHPRSVNTRRRKTLYRGSPTSCLVVYPR